MLNTFFHQPNEGEQRLSTALGLTGGHAVDMALNAHQSLAVDCELIDEQWLNFECSKSPSGSDPMAHYEEFATRKSGPLSALPWRLC